MESPKKPVTVQNSQPYGHPRPDSMGMRWNPSNLHPELFEDGAKEFGDLIELIEIERLPRNLRILAEVWFMLLPERVYWRVHRLQTAVGRVFDNLRPGLIRFAKRHRIRVANAAVPSQSLIWKLGDVRSAHHHRNTSGTEGIRGAVRLGDHPCHCPDSDEADSPIFDELHKLPIVHWFRITVQQQYLVLRGRSCLKQEHP